jgi:hypothetical protein
MADLSSILGAPVDLRGGSAIPSVFVAWRISGALFPLAGVRVMAEPVIEYLDRDVLVDQASGVRGAGWQCSNFLAVWGLLPVQACSGGVAAGFAGVTCCSMKTTLG